MVNGSEIQNSLTFPILKFGALVGEHASGIFALFLIIAGNFLGPLLNCDVRGGMFENIYVKHVIALFTLYFFVVLIDNKNVHMSIWKQMTQLITIYLFFVVLTRCDGRFFAVAIVLLAMLYIAHIQDTHIRVLEEQPTSAFAQRFTDDEKAHLDNVKRVRSKVENTLRLKTELLLLVLLLIVSFLGIVFYFGRHSWWTWEQFLHPITKCNVEVPPLTRLDIWRAGFKRLVGVRTPKMY